MTIRGRVLLAALLLTAAGARAETFLMKSGTRFDGRILSASTDTLSVEEVDPPAVSVLAWLADLGHRGFSSNVPGMCQRALSRGHYHAQNQLSNKERATGFEPATPSLGSSYSTD